jgi:rhomboid family protein
VFPVTETAPRAACPAMMLALMAANTLVFLFTLALPARELNSPIFHYALIPGRYTHPALARAAGLGPHDYWPPITDAFLHGGWLHIIFNMWFLWIVGPAMEARFGCFWFLVLYFAGALAASGLQLVIHPDSAEPMLGASGAIAAVIAAYALVYPSERVITIVPIFFIPLFIPVPAIRFAGLWIAPQVLQGTTELMRPMMGAGVARWAHIGDFGFGALFALIAAGLRRGAQTPITRRSDMYDKRVYGRRVPDFPPRERE